MKTKKYLFLLSMLVSFLFETISCSNPNTSPIEDETSKENTTKKEISFDMTSLKGLAITEGIIENRSAARSASQNTLVKITENGEIQKFLNVPENCQLASIEYITKAPNENSKEIYIVFNGVSYWYEYTEKTDEWGHTYQESIEHKLGSLICVFEDGSYLDLANSGANIDDIKFDESGNMYYLVTDWSAGSSKDMIYKFNPTTKNSDKLVADISGTNYDNMYISKNGDWIFVKGSRWSNNNNASFLRAIPTSSPNNSTNIYYSGESYKEIKWIYNETSRDVYYIVDYQLCRIPYINGTYNIDNVEIIAKNTTNEYNFSSNNELSESLLEYKIINQYSLGGRAEGYDVEQDKNRQFYFIDTITKEINYKEIVDYFFSRLRDFLQTTGEYIESDEYTTDIGYSKFVPFNFREQYEIRFDEFSNIEGFERLAIETNKNGFQLADEELFKVIIEKDLLSLLGNAITSTRYNTPNTYNAYNYNFFADILYNKTTNQKIDSSLFYWDKNVGFDQNVRTGDYYSHSLNFLTEEIKSGYFWKNAYINTDTGKVDAKKIFAKITELSGHDEIDFSLDFFRYDSKYSELYTDKKNEDAIHFLSESIEKTDIFNDAIWYNTYEFMKNTCYIPNTTISVFDTTNKIQWDYLQELIIADKALYGYETQNNKIVQFTDNEGESVLKYVDFYEYSTPIKITSTLVHENKFYLKNAILSSNGLETGKHNILRFNPESSSIEEMLWDMPNNSDYEITSYSIMGKNLYCCFVRGTEVIIGEIDLTSKNYNKFATSEAELKQIMIVR